MLLREELDNPAESPDSNEYLDQYFTFVGAVYWGRLAGRWRRSCFAIRSQVPTASRPTRMAFAAVRVYIPRWQAGLLAGASIHS